MLLDLDVNAVTGRVFLIYGAFWLVVLVGLFFGVGALISKAEKRKHH